MELKFGKLMETSWEKDENGRLQIRLPNTLENNREQALNRDIKIRQQLSKKVEVLKLFEEQIGFCDGSSVGIRKCDLFEMPQ